jgi:hypothetical protein
MAIRKHPETTAIQPAGGWAWSFVLEHFSTPSIRTLKFVIRNLQLAHLVLGIFATSYGS